MSLTTQTNFNKPFPRIAGDLARLARWFGDCLHTWATNYIAYRERQIALAALRRYSDRDLKDIGLYRCQLEAAVAGRLQNEFGVMASMPVAPQPVAPQPVAPQSIESRIPEKLAA